MEMSGRSKSLIPLQAFVRFEYREYWEILLVAVKFREAGQIRRSGFPAFAGVQIGESNATKTRGMR